MVVYIREAHPDDGWQTKANKRDKVIFIQPTKLAERNKVATVCSANLNLSIPFVVDKMDNKVNESYAGWPDRLYIVGKDGKIAYKGAPGPRGFKVREMADKLASIVGKKEGGGGKK